MARYGSWDWLPDDICETMDHCVSAAAEASLTRAGKKDPDAVDEVAVDQISEILNKTAYCFKVRACEGAEDQPPRHQPGDILGGGTGEPDFELVIDPIDGTRGVAKGRGRAVSAIAISLVGGLTKIPDCYFEHFLVGSEYSEVMETDTSLWRIMENFPSDKKGRAIVLLRPRNSSFIGILNSRGWSVSMEETSEVAAGLDVVDGKYDLLAGIGGGPETVLLAVAVKGVGGRLEARPSPADDQQREKLIDTEFADGASFDQEYLVKKPAALFISKVEL